MVLLPEGSEMTLAELREMAARQQHQIEAQQHLLVAKEQRLKFLKQQEARHYSLAEQQSETERLHVLREKVETQELKLRHLKALRAQIDQQRANNGNLGAELESIRALFSEKEKELNVAVIKVEELTRQLEEIRNSNKRKSNTPPSLVSKELDKLRRELMYRTKLAEQQSSHISQQRDILSQKQQEISIFDQRIGELQQRLHRKRLLNQQLASQIHCVTLAKHSVPSSVTDYILPVPSNVAAVEPMKRDSQESDHAQDDLSAKLHISHKGDLSEFCQTKNDPKYQTLPYNTKFTVKGHKITDDFLLTSKDEVCSSSPNILSSHQPSSQKTVLPHLLSKPHHNLSNFSPRPFSSTYSSNAHGSVSPKLVSHQMSNNVLLTQSSVSATTISGPAGSVPYKGEVNEETFNELNPLHTTVSQNCQLSATVSNSQLIKEKLKPSLDDVSSHPSQRVKDIELRNQIQLSTPTISSQLANKPIVPPKPSLPVKPIPPPRQTPLATTKVTTDGEKNDVISMALSVLQNSASDKDKTTCSNYRERLLYYRCIPRYPMRHDPFFRDSVTPVSKVGTLPKSTSDHCEQSVNDVTKRTENGEHQDVIKRRPSNGQLPIKPKPLTIRKTPGLEPPRLKIHQNINSGINRRILDVNINTTSPQLFINSNVTHTTEKDETTTFVSSPIENDINSYDPPTQTDSPSIIEGNDETEMPTRCEEVAKNENVEIQDTSIIETAQLPEAQIQQSNEDTLNTDESKLENDENSQVLSSSSTDLQLLEVLESVITDESNEISPHQSAALRRVKKGNLKTEGSVRSPRRVSFDPLALLLDAALEGELELVKKTSYEVPNPSAANDEGITALHNAICAGHFEIVTFLIEFGCDVNAQDSDGWTPLHCAASCNNLPMVKYLVERGACIFATTLSDHETAAEKCEEDEEGFDGCSEYLYNLQENLGVMNDKIVYAVYDYEVQNSDELSFKDGDMLTVLRKGDDQEKEWWWSKHTDQEGYVPRNLLGLYPRVSFRKE